MTETCRTRERQTETEREREREKEREEGNLEDQKQRSDGEWKIVIRGQGDVEERNFSYFTSSDKRKTVN